MPEVTIDQALQIALQHHQAGRLPEAEQLCRQLLAVQPNHSDALNLLGVLAHQVGRNDIAVDLARRAIAIKPTAAEYHSNLGNLLQADGQTRDAIAAYRRALEINPGLAEVHNNLGSAFTELGQSQNAMYAHHTAIQIDPQLPQPHSNLGNALTDLGRIDEAITAYRTALALRPDYAEVHWNMAMCLLLKGDYVEGWREYEWRWKCKDGDYSRGDHSGRGFRQPLWDGGKFAGRTILLHAEQGFGDTLQFIRYIPLVAERGGKIVVECQPELIGLLKQIPGVTQWVAFGEPLPPFDVHRPLLSLPFVFGTTLQTIPKHNPPLKAPAQHTEDWRRRIANHRAKFKVGLAWAGSPHHKNDRNRSIPPSLLAALAGMRQIRFFSLQKGPTAEQSEATLAEMNLVDMTAELRDFTDTAALIASLDLVISVDTAVAHLAGAMGKPVWLLLPSAPDWRWLLNRSDSPWYPTMRLFRQTRIGDWPGVIERVAVELAQLAGPATFR